MCLRYSDPSDPQYTGRWVTRQKAKDHYPYCIMARFVFYFLLVHATRATALARYVIASTTLLFLLWVWFNWRFNQPTVWWSRKQLMAFLVLLGSIQWIGDGYTRQLATIVVLTTHLLFSATVCYRWYTT